MIRILHKITYLFAMLAMAPLAIAGMMLLLASVVLFVGGMALLVAVVWAMEPFENDAWATEGKEKQT